MPREPESSVSTPPAAAIESTRATPAARVQPTAAVPVAPPESPLVSSLRSRFGSNHPYVAIVDSQRTDYHGTFNLIVVQAITAESTAVDNSIYVVNEARVEPLRPVASWTTQWPDFTARIDRVTPDSVYVTGTSASYRRTLKRAYRWWPSGDFTPPHGPPSLAKSAPVCDDTLRVDLAAKTIAGIWIDQPIEAVTRAVGAANVIAGTAYAEGGEPVLEYTVRLCGHEIRRTWKSASWHDPVFRSPEGLGVGSSLAAFDTAYGNGEAIAEEGESVRYWPPNGIGYFFLDVPDGCSSGYRAAGRPTVDRTCRVSGISFIVFTKP
ncbi:MAG TPA: hypothetical protein VGQ29_07890 [Gemmatimonadales bacterium]|nr:hypothetical protein [Gemmatimonadales bacterium]